MELRHGDVAAERRRLPRKAFVGMAVAVAGLIYFGTMHIAAENNRPRQNAAASTASRESGGSCDSVFTDKVKRRIDGIVESKVSARAESLKRLIGAGAEKAFISVSVGVDRGGRPVVEDVWSYPEPASGRMEAGDLVESLTFDGLRLAAPREGMRCSYTVPVGIENI